MGRARKAAAATIAGFLALASIDESLARGQTNYRTVPIGERAIGMGGAYTGLADDPSATYYNPAGLVRKDIDQFSGAMNLAAFGQLAVSDGISTPIGSQDLDERSLRTLSAFVGARLGVGKPKHGREHRFALAYSTVQPVQESTVFDTNSAQDMGFSAARISRRYRTTYHGFTMAGAVSRKLTLGGTLFLSIQRFSLGEELSVAVGERESEGSFIDPFARTQSADVSFRAFHFVPRLGVLYRFNLRWSLGVMFQTPGIPLAGSGSTRIQRTTIRAEGSPEPSAFAFEDSGDLSVKAPIPWELRVGAAYEPHPRILLTLDASIHGRTRDEERIRGQDAAQGSILYYSNSTERRFIGNVAVGIEYDFGSFDMQGGFLTNLSASPSVPDQTEEYVPSQINLYGAAIAFEYDSERFHFSSGFTFQWGRGEALGTFVDPIAETVAYQRESAVSRKLFFHFAGAFRAAAKATKDILERGTDEDQDAGSRR